MRPPLTVVVPTQGRATLPRLLASIDLTLCEVIVVADTHSPLLSDVRALCDRVRDRYLPFDPQVRYLELDAGRHDYGYPQITLGYREAAGRWIACIGDDDVYEPGALASMAAVLDGAPSRPHLFKVELHPSPTRGCRSPDVVWDEPRLRRGRISTQNVVVPNDQAKLAEWTDDFDFIETSVRQFGGVVWRDELIARCY